VRLVCVWWICRRFGYVLRGRVHQTASITPQDVLLIETSTISNRQFVVPRLLSRRTPTRSCPVHPGRATLPQPAPVSAFDQQ